MTIQLINLARFLIASITNGLIYLNYSLYKYDLTEHEIIDSCIPSDDGYKAETINGYVPMMASHLKKKSVIYRVETEDGLSIECADNHLLYTPKGQTIFTRKLKVGYSVLTRKGISKVSKVKKLSKKKFVFDLTIGTGNHSYYTDDFVSHNSIVSGIFIVWYLLCNSHKTVVLTSVNEKKVKELVEKIENILKELPFYMKLGMIYKNVLSHKYDNECKLLAETTTSASGAGATAGLFYADEFALIQKRLIREFFRTVYPTLSASEVSRMIITSTPRGLNKFYDIYTDALNSKNIFNPIRTDWYEVPLKYDKNGEPVRDKNGNIIYRGDEWKLKETAQIGSEQDFNQEYGCQFLAGNTLLFNTSLLRKIKRLQTEFVHRQIEVYEDRGIQYEDLLKWHPLFDMGNLQANHTKFVISIDLAEGGGGDYSVVNIHQILPMSEKEIKRLYIYTEEKDFFKLVQVGMFRSNKVAIPELSILFYHLVTEVIIQDNVKCVLENNYDGNYFRHQVNKLYGENNEIEEEHLWVQFPYNMKDDNQSDERATRYGLNNTEGTKDHGCKVVKDKIKYNQLIVVEKMTVEESVSFAKNKKGKYESQTEHDDCIMTEINITHFYETIDYIEQIDELMEFCSDEFIELMSSKLNKVLVEEGGDEDITDVML